MTVMQSQAGSLGSTGTQCEQCVQQGIICMVVDGGARCANCKVKHYGCLLVVVKEPSGRKGGVAGSQTVKVATGSQTRGKVKRGKNVKRATLSGLIYVSGHHYHPFRY